MPTSGRVLKRLSPTLNWRFLDTSAINFLKSDIFLDDDLDELDFLLLELELLVRL